MVFYLIQYPTSPDILLFTNLSNQCQLTDKKILNNTIELYVKMLKSFMLK